MEAEAYLDMAAAEAEHWWFRGRRQILRSVIAGLALPESASILELGSGTGGNLAMLSAFGRVTAVELDDHARLISIKKAGDAGVPLDIRAGALPDRLPLDGQTFDLIALFDVLEHVEQEAETLTAIARHLAPGGRVVLTVPAFQWLWGPHDVAMHHKRRYAKADLRRACLAAGFAIERLSYMNSGLFPLAVAARVVERLRPGTGPNATKTPPRLMNEAFAAIFGGERHLLRWVNLPVGLSLIAVLRGGVGVPAS